jgi:hypothetical protein
MTTNKQSSQVILFLGAGASIAAGVPDTYSFVTEFINSIREPGKKETVRKIVEILSDWKGSDIDVELLLETLTKLEKKTEEPLLRFYKGGDFILKGYSEKDPIIGDLKDFIKSRAIVTEDKIQYLKPIIGFVDEFRPLDIISVNYDTCIEQLCNVHKLTYQDGFEVHWSPKTFYLEHTDIRVYKLHGSVMWYQSDRGGYIKLPVMKETAKIQLITGETAENLMLYPMQKWGYAEPLLELLIEIKKLLESETSRFLIVAGYSFRDDHIRKIIWDSARKNKDLHLILVDPNAYQIYSEKLQYYDETKRNPSSLSGRVVCLPYRFEDVLPYLKNYYIRNLRDALINETNLRQNEMRGEKVDWLSTLKVLINAEHAERVELLLERIGKFDLEKDWQLNLEFPLRMASNLFFNKQNGKANEYLKKFYRVLYRMMVERISISIAGEPPVLEVYFNYVRDKSGSSCIEVESLKKVIEILIEFCNTRSKFVIKTSNEIQETTERLKKLKNYLDQFKEGKIRIGDYISLREITMIPQIDQFKKVYKTYQGQTRLLDRSGSSPREKLTDLAMQIEKAVLEEIITL